MIMITREAEIFLGIKEIKNMYMRARPGLQTTAVSPLCYSMCKFN